jgi:hypothetical protein
VNVLRERAILTDFGSQDVGTWGDIYDDELEKSKEFEEEPVPGVDAS